MSDHSDVDGNLDHKEELLGAMREAGLPDLEVLLGKTFIFSSKHGSHTTTLGGTITAVQHSNEGGLELHISCPRFWGLELFGLIHDKDETWITHLSDPKEFFRGHLTLL